MKLTSDIRKLMLSRAQYCYDKKRPLESSDAELHTTTTKGYFKEHASRMAKVREHTRKRQDYINNLRYLLGTFSTVSQLEEEWPEAMALLEGITLNPRQFTLVI